MARERSIVVRLKAEVSDFRAQMSSAARSLSDFEREQAKLGGAATTTMGRLVQSARINDREWTAVGRVFLGVGTAMAAVGTAALKTGIDYNALRQRATQSLTAVTGSTEEAAAQMKRLDDFGRGSWLMRDSLIRAQQQMTGFGIETHKVIPYMEALADAVAATGGTNQDFEELARLMGQIQSQGKITARELMQFGMRGIDAAQLIGDAMGKTAGQIRDEITAGTLDAGEALDALAQGMGDRFEGASDLVRDTFGGAVDNMAAAWRDFGAELAKPLVDPDGGGLLVDFLNKVADGLNSLQASFAGLPDSLQTTSLLLGGLATAGTLAAGSFLVLAPRIVETSDAIATLVARHPGIGRFGRGVERVGRAVSGAGIALVSFNVAGKAIESWTTSGAKGVNEIAAAMEAVGAGTAEAGDLFEDVFNTRIQNELIGGGIADLESALDFLIEPNWIGSTQTQLRKMLGLWSGTEMGQLEARLGEIDTHLTGLSGESLPDAVAQFSGLNEAFGGTDETAAKLLLAMPGFRDALVGIANDAGLATDDATLLAIATGQLEVAADGAEDAVDDASDAVDEFGNSVDDAAGSVRQKNEELRAMHEMLREASDQLLDAREAERRWHQALDDATEAVERNGKTLDITTEAGRDNEAQLDNLISTGRDWVQGMADQGASQSELRGAVQRVRDSFIDQAVQMGLNKRDAERLADQYRLFPDQIDTFIKAHTGDAEENIRRMKARWDGQTITFYQRIVTTGAGATHPAAAMPRYHGGVVPGLRAGGRVPGPRAGYDNVAWPLYAGGQVLTQPLEGGEFVVRSSQAVKHGPLLQAINEGRFQGGFVSGSGSGVGVVSLSDRDVGRIAEAVRSGSSEGVSEGLGGVGRSVRLRGVGG